MCHKEATIMKLGEFELSDIEVCDKVRMYFTLLLECGDVEAEVPVEYVHFNRGEPEYVVVKEDDLWDGINSLHGQGADEEDELIFSFRIMHESDGVWLSREVKPTACCDKKVVFEQ